MNINELAKRVYEQNKAVGWWDDPDRCVFQTLQLVNTEIAEATEGDRKNLMDDKLPHRKMAEVEMADTLIRLVDLAGRYNWIYIQNVSSSDYLREVSTTAGRHLVATMTVCELARRLMTERWIDAPDPYDIAVRYSFTINTILSICELEGYEIEGAVEEKLQFNATRIDHSREHRAKAGGKKY